MILEPAKGTQVQLRLLGPFRTFSRWAAKAESAIFSLIATVGPEG